MKRLLCVVSLLLVACPEPPAQVGLPSPATVPVPVSPVPTAPVPTPPPAATVSLHVVGYNVESGDAEAATIAGHVEMISGEHIWGFSEVENQQWLDSFTVAADDDEQGRFANVLGTTGWSDRLGVAWDTSKVTYESHEELQSIGFNSYRAPLVVTFLLNDTDVRFKFMVNHLARGNADVRHDQAVLLNDWAQTEALPVVSVGDFNFDWDVENGDVDHDMGYDNLTLAGRWTWIRPDDLVKTQCTFREDSVLDFVFAAGGAKDWASEGDILLRGNVYCQDNNLIPDHRPVQAVFHVPLPTEN